MYSYILKKSPRYLPDTRTSTEGKSSSWSAAESTMPPRTPRYIPPLAKNMCAQNT